MLNGPSDGRGICRRLTEKRGQLRVLNVGLSEDLFLVLCYRRDICCYTGCYDGIQKIRRVRKFSGFKLKMYPVTTVSIRSFKESWQFERGPG